METNPPKIGDTPLGTRPDPPPKNWRPPPPKNWRPPLPPKKLEINKELVTLVLTMGTFYLCPKFARSQPEVGPKFARSQPEVSPKFARSLPEVSPKLARSLPEVCPKSARSWPEVSPDWLLPHHPIPNAKFQPITL